MPNERPPCPLCGKPVRDEREFHPKCWPKAKAHLDAVLGMARRKYGPGFALNVFDSSDGYTVIQMNFGPPAQAEGTLEERLSDTKEAVASEPVLEDLLKDPCLCSKDADGRCPKCIGIISGYLKGVVELQKEMIERHSKLTTVKEVCEPCSTEYLDFSMAKTLKEVLAPMREDLGTDFKEPIQALARMMRGQFDKKGIRAWPLFEKAMKELGLG